MLRKALRTPLRARMPKRESVSESGLIIVRDDLTPEQKKERREDNKAMKRSREIHRRRKKHGRHC